MPDYTAYTWSMFFNPFSQSSCQTKILFYTGSGHDCHMYDAVDANEMTPMRRKKLEVRNQPFFSRAANCCPES